MEGLPEIPDKITELMRDNEIENMQNLDGWAVGTICHIDMDGNITREIKGAWIELFDGEGGAGIFDGVRFMAVDNGEYEESYAHESREHLEKRRDGEKAGLVGSVSGSYPAWFVKEYNFQ